MTLQQLHYIITISEAGSLSRAAEMLYVSQPSLSSAVKELERETGITIFYRSGRGVTPTADGAEFLLYARQLYQQYESLLEKYVGESSLKKKFAVSAQNYSFAVQAFVEMAKAFDMAEYDFAVRETQTGEVISDVANMRSEIGILYLSDYNRKAIGKMLEASGLEFHRIVDCRAYAYLWREHPLASREGVTLADLEPYPCLSFEQGQGSSFYLAEELYSPDTFKRTVHVTDRATMLNLMVGLGGYTVCSGIICGELNGDGYVAVPIIEAEGDTPNMMEIGYIMKKNTFLSRMGELYLSEIKRYLRRESGQMK